MNNRYSEENLIDPALFVLFKFGGALHTYDLIVLLTKILNPTDEDSEILFGRNDTRFSQKVKNLISHKKICPQYADYDSEQSLLKINEMGVNRLFNSSFYFQNKDLDVDFYKEMCDNDEDDMFADDDNYSFLNKQYVECEPVNYSVYELKRRYDKRFDANNAGSIILDDTFQRNVVWSNKQKSQLIESLILGIPIPYLYLYEGKQGNLIVIDGRQRLSSIFEFLDDKFKLSYLEFLKGLNGLRSKDLVGKLEKYKAKIEDSHLHVIKVRYETSEIFKLKIFQRVNQGGTKLNNQELRHALHQGAITFLLKELSDSLDIFSGSAAKNRMKDRYLILRYIAIRLYLKKQLIYYGGRNFEKCVEYYEINTFLADAMDAINTFSDDQIDEIRFNFHQAYQMSIKVLGADKAFRIKENTPINMIIFETTLLFASGILENELYFGYLPDMVTALRKSDFSVDYKNKLSFFDNIKYHRDSRNNFLSRLKVIKKILNDFRHK